MSDGRASTCPNCGREVAGGALFCRGCGTRLTAPQEATGKATTAPRRRTWMFAAACLVAALLGAGVATAVLLGSGGSDGSQTAAGETGHGEATVPASSPELTNSSGVTSAQGEAGSGGEAAGSIAAGEYLQAGSFRLVSDAEAERERLEERGIPTLVVDSDQAQELYPGFQVLIVGPLASPGERRSLLNRLHRNGVPSAFARPLSPARSIAGAEAAAGDWSGSLEVTGEDRPGQDGTVKARLSVTPDGRDATLEVSGRGCATELSLLVATAVTLSYSQRHGCFGDGEWVVRPEGNSVALTLLPPESDTIVVGRLRR
ncbi:MAG: zinc ribbon domain-containing protein [Solirubrobacterales bacterium]